MTTAQIVQSAPAVDRQAVKEMVSEVLSKPGIARIVVRPDEALTGSGDDASDVFFAAVLARLMIAERLDVDVAYAPAHPTAATVVYGLPHGAQALDLAGRGRALSIPLIRDDAATVLVGHARHLGVEGRRLHGESYVDDTRLFTGEVRGVRIEPTPTAPGLRARIERPLRLPGSGGGGVWGRAAQTGGENLVVEREGVLTPRVVKRSTFYRHHVDLRLVRP